MDGRPGAHVFLVRIYEKNLWSFPVDHTASDTEWTTHVEASKTPIMMVPADFGGKRSFIYHYSGAHYWLRPLIMLKRGGRNASFKGCTSERDRE